MNGTDISTEGTLDPVLRDRIEFEFDEVMHAFDAALDEPSPAAREELGAAADELMRAGAVILLALSRAEQSGR